MQIETNRLVLRNYTQDDMEDYWEYASQPNVGPRCGWTPHTNRESALERLIYETKRPFQFAIELKENHKVVGSIELDDTRPSILKTLDCKPSETREIGCLLNENFWGKGIMTEAMRAVIKYGFEYMGLRVIAASYFEPNIGSGKVQQKCGLKPFQRTKECFVWYETGKKCDSIDCKITREEYTKLQEYKTFTIKVIK